MAASYELVQRDLSSTISKALTNFKKSPKDRITVSYVETRLKALEQKWKMFDTTHRQFMVDPKAKAEFKKSLYCTEDLYDQTEEVYLDYKALLKEALLKLKPCSSERVETSRCAEQSVKLPKITLPKFSGNYSEWVSFRDMFVSVIHKNGTLDNVQKLHYLKSSLTGEAEQLLRHIPITSEAYKECWTQLENRYNNKKYLVNCIMKRLFGQKSLTSESSNGLKVLLDTTKECLQALKNLSVNVSSWDIIVIYIISQKLDPESRKMWEQEVTKSTRELPLFQDFEQFLEIRFRSLEYLDPRLNKADKVNCSHVTTTSTNMSGTCVFCSEGHKLCNCKKFSKESLDTRRKFVQSKNLCFNYLSSGHSVYECTSSTNCRLCKKRHHTLLHLKSFRSVPQANSEQPPNNVVATVTTSEAEEDESPESPGPVVTCFANTHGKVLLATALVKVVCFTQTVTLRALIDQGSQASFITEAAVQMLGLTKMPCVSLVSGVGGDHGSTVTSKSTVLVNVQSRLDPSFAVLVKAHVLTKLTSFLPSKKVLVELLPAVSPFELADLTFDTPNKIDLLLGADVYGQILCEGLIKAPSSSVVAQHTRFGWILSGKIRAVCANQGEESNRVIAHVCTYDENDLLKKFWELESEPSSIKTKHLTMEEIFYQTTSRDVSGRYIVKLPFRSDDRLCKAGGSREIACKRFFSLERRLLSSPSLKIEYSDVLKEYLQLGHMKIIPPNEVNNPMPCTYHIMRWLNKTGPRLRFESSMMPLAKDSTGSL